MQSLVITDRQHPQTVLNRIDLFQIDNDKLVKIKNSSNANSFFTLDHRKGVNHEVPGAKALILVTILRQMVTFVCI